MKKDNSGISMVFSLAAVCVIAAAALGAVYRGTEGRITENIRKKTEAAVYEVISGITGYEKVSEDPVVYIGKNADIVEGYAVLAEGMGFQGNIKIMVGISADRSRFTGIKVLDSVETPGLGDRIKEESFSGQFKEKETPQKGSELEIDMITGATISSKAVQKIVKKAIEDAERIH